MKRTRPTRTGLAISLTTAFVLIAAGLFLSPRVAQAESNTTQLAIPSVPEGNETCLTCHSKPMQVDRGGQQTTVQVDPAVYDKSVHGIISCVRCHAEAGPEHAKDPGKPLNLPTGRELAVLKSEGCVKCHGGLYPESYQLSFHGVAVTNGDYRAATCVDCHGVHDILPSRNPESHVAPANLAQTCGTSGCHVNPPENFSNGKEHFIAADVATSGGVGIVYKFFMALILFDTMKDGPIVMFQLLRQLVRH